MHPPPLSLEVAAIMSNLFLSHWVRLPYDNQQEHRYVIIYIVLGARGGGRREGGRGGLKPEERAIPSS